MSSLQRCFPPPRGCGHVFQCCVTSAYVLPRRALRTASDSITMIKLLSTLLSSPLDNLQSFFLALVRSLLQLQPVLLKPAPTEHPVLFSYAFFSPRYNPALSSRESDTRQITCWTTWFDGRRSVGKIRLWKYYRRRDTFITNRARNMWTMAI